MNAISNDQIFHQLGSLTTEITALRRETASAEARAEKAMEQASQHRGAIHARVDKVAADVADLNTKMAVMSKKVDGLAEDVKPGKEAAAEIKRWKQMGVGALAVTGIAAAAITSTFWYFWADVAKSVRAWLNA